MSMILYSKMKNAEKISYLVVVMDIFSLCDCASLDYGV